MTRRILLTFILVLAVCGTALAEPSAAAPAPAAADTKPLSVRTFQFKHKDADKAAALIKPLMSAAGSLSIQPSANSLVVTDRPENLKAIIAALAQYDAPPQQFTLSVRLVAAGRVDPAAAPRTPDELKDVAPKLGLLRFNAFDMLGSANVVGHEGENGIVEMPTGYRADFHFGEYDPASDSIKVSDFKLSKLQGEQKDQLAQLIKTTLNLKIGQTVIIGATRVPESQRALMIIVAARR